LADGKGLCPFLNKPCIENACALYSSSKLKCNMYMHGKEIKRSCDNCMYMYRKDYHHFKGTCTKLKENADWLCISKGFDLWVYMYD